MSEIVNFFQWNEGTADLTVLWESFKAYMQGSLVSLNVWKIKKSNRYRDSLTQQLKELERKHKISPEVIIQEEMDWVINIVKLLNAKVVAMDSMYA